MISNNLRCYGALICIKPVNQQKTYVNKSDVQGYYHQTAIMYVLLTGVLLKFFHRSTKLKCLIFYGENIFASKLV